MQQAKEIGNSRSNWWWVYFALCALIWAASILAGEHSVPSVFVDIYYGIGLIGLWGYISSQKIGWKTFWAGYFVLMVAGFVYSVAANISLARTDPAFILAISAFAILLSIPQWIAAWRYAFKSPEIWGS